METKTTKPFPWMCMDCRTKTVIIQRRDYRLSAVHDGTTYNLLVPGADIPTCTCCGYGVIIEDVSEKITNELRRAAGLLMPEQIQAKRESLGLTQAELAATLRVSEEALNRWETGMQLQSRTVDLLLRLYFDSVDVRRAFPIAASVEAAELSATSS